MTFSSISPSVCYCCYAATAKWKATYSTPSRRERAAECLGGYRVLGCLTTSFMESSQNSIVCRNETVLMTKRNQELRKKRGVDIDRSWNGRLIRLGNEAAHMQYLIAYLSTLGGAYHLCNHPKTALGIARKLEAVALRLGSTVHLIRSRTYQAVNLYLLGKKKNARYFLSICKQMAIESGNPQLISFVDASDNWLRTNGSDTLSLRHDMITAV